MPAHLHHPGRLLTSVFVMGGLAVASLAVPNSPLTSRAQASGSTTTVGPGVDLKLALMTLEPGDTLALLPGVYSTGMVSPTPATTGLPKVDIKGTVKRMSVGTAAAPITVRAADPANRPLILGELKMWGPSYWVLDGLRVQAVDAGKDALYIGGGTGWVVKNSEFFGASATGAYSNVTISSDIYATPAPRAFTFTGNCVHDAGQSARKTTDHNIYVSFEGASGSGGVISKNVIFNHRNGAGIKLGNGGVERARGPWGVKVVYNTIAQGGRQVLLHGDVRNNTIARNIFATSTQRFSGAPKTTSVYLNKVVGGGNTFVNNYATNSTMFSWGTNAKVSGDNAVRANPRFASVGCDGFRPTFAKAGAYGRYGSGVLPRW